MCDKNRSFKAGKQQLKHLNFSPHYSECHLPSLTQNLGDITDRKYAHNTPARTAHTLTHARTAHTLTPARTAHTLTHARTAHTLTPARTAHTLTHARTAHTLTHARTAHTLTRTASETDV